MKTEELNKLYQETTQQLENRIAKLQSELIDTKMQIKLNKQKNTKQAGNIRNKIAVIKTIITQKLLETSERNTKS